MQLRTQMTQKDTLKFRQNQQTAFEKQEVDSQINRLIQEDLRQIEAEKSKKEAAFAAMQTALAQKESVRRQEILKAKAEEARLKDYLNTADQRNVEVLEKKTQLEANKQAIYEALRKTKEEKMKDQKEIETLKHELMMEEQREKERRMKQESETKARQSREEMARWEEAAKALKEKARIEEKGMEDHFKKVMLEEFERKEKLEQMNQQKRRMVEAQHKRDVEGLWQEKLVRIRAEKEVARKEAEARELETKWENQVVLQEKRKILESHLPNIQDACCPSLWDLAQTLTTLK